MIAVPSIETQQNKNTIMDQNSVEQWSIEWTDSQLPKAEMHKALVSVPVSIHTVF